MDGCRRLVRHGTRVLCIVLVLAALVLAPLWAPVARADEQWVQTYVPTELWSNPGPDAISFGKVRAFSYFRLHSAQVGGRFYVYNPLTQNFAYLDARALGPSGPPPADYLARPRVLERLNVPARAVGTASVWREPIEDDEVWSHDVPHNGTLMIRDAVEGEDGETWYRLADGGFVQPDHVRMPPPAEARGGRWIEVSLESPTIVTAYETGKVVYSALAIHGTGGWETPIGTFVVERRVANERMVGPGYDVSGVLFTQYFTSAGHSLHYNYWSSNWGYAGSHGCLGLTYDDALWFWEWASLGTPVVIHW